MPLKTSKLHARVTIGRASLDVAGTLNERSRLCSCKIGARRGVIRRGRTRFVHLVNAS
jgi:hypothetical protein